MSESIFSLSLGVKLNVGVALGDIRFLVDGNLARADDPNSRASVFPVVNEVEAHLSWEAHAAGGLCPKRPFANQPLLDFLTSSCSADFLLVFCGAPLVLFLGGPQPSPS
ncbi:hypothetical protein Emag_002909 [Eimeria magna]